MSDDNILRRRAPLATETRLRSPFVTGFAFVLGGLLAVGMGVAVLSLSTILIWIGFALFAALGCDPIVGRLERHGLTRTWSIVLIYGTLTAIMVSSLWLIVPIVIQQSSLLVDSLPKIVSDFQASETFEWIQRNLGEGVSSLVQQAQALLADPASLAAIGGGLLRAGSSLASTISGLITVLVLSLYFLASLPAMKATFVRLAPAYSRDTVSSLTEEIASSVGGYLLGMIILAACNAGVTLVLHLVLGLSFPWLMGAIALIVTIIPLIGSVLFWVVASALALFTNPWTALVFAALYLVYMQVEAYVLTPRIMNRTIAVPGALVVIGALVGGTLLGLLGALVAIPITASVLLVIKKVWIPRQDAAVVAAKGERHD